LEAAEIEGIKAGGAYNTVQYGAEETAPAQDHHALLLQPDHRGMGRPSREEARPVEGNHWGLGHPMTENASAGTAQSLGHRLT